jgi:hypothetical protein
VHLDIEIPRGDPLRGEVERAFATALAGRDGCRVWLYVDRRDTAWFLKISDPLSGEVWCAPVRPGEQTGQGIRSLVRSLMEATPESACRTVERASHSATTPGVARMREVADRLRKLCPGTTAPRLPARDSA